MVESKLDTIVLMAGLGGLNLVVLLDNIQGFFAFITVTITMIIAVLKLREFLQEIADKKKRKKNE